MQRIFVKYLTFVMAMALLSIAALNYVLQTHNFQQKMCESAVLKMNQIFHTIVSNRRELAALSESLRDDYLTRARAFAFIIEQNPSVLDSPSELQKVKTLLNVDELHVIDENGVLIRGTIPKYFGMQFSSTTQTAEFLQILHNPEISIVQDIRPNGAEQKIFQYVGVARKDQPGIVQIGLEPKRQLTARHRNELTYIFSRIALDADTNIFALDTEGRILAHSDSEKNGQNFLDFGFPADYLEKFHDGAFFTPNDLNEPRFFIIRRYDDIILGFSQTKHALYAGLPAQLLLVTFYLTLTFLALLFAIRFLLKKKIVNGMHQIMADLTEITKGNLDNIVAVDDNPEFQQLSAKINLMVRNLLETTVKISRIIDLVGAPIGAFEYKRDMNRVLATDRLRHILSLSKEEAQTLYSDKQKFIETLDGYRQNPEPDEEDIYRIGAPPAKWIKLRTVSDASGTFGIVSDVTQEIAEKQHLKRERDYDELTGLHSHRSFRRIVTNLMEQGNLKTAALLMFDLDAFKQINDKHGHACGDDYLRATARFLAQCGKENGVVGRRSGDEFYLFLYRLNSKEALYERLHAFYKHLEETPFVFPDGTQAIIQISAGIAWETPQYDFDAFLAAADCALYKAKNDPLHKFREF